MGVLLAFLATTSALFVLSVNGEVCKRRVCYYDSSGQNRPTSESRLLPHDIHTGLCSHIIYLQSVLTTAGITPTKSSDVSSDNVVGNYEKVTNMKAGNADLKVLLALRIHPSDAVPFLKITSSESSISEFADKVVQFLRSHNFDGLDIHFSNYLPGTAHPGIKYRISKVLEQLRLVFDAENTDYGRLLLTAAVYGENILDDNTFDVKKISRNVDWINLLAYNLSPNWRGVTSLFAPLYPNPGGKSHEFNADSAVEHWIDQGTPRGKIVLGIPFFGRPHILTSEDTRIGAPVSGLILGKHTSLGLGLAYYEICEINREPHSEYYYLHEQATTYLVSGNIWISFNDINSVRQKIRYIKEHHLGGFAADSIDFDDFAGHFCGVGPYPLLNAANMECTS